MSSKVQICNMALSRLGAATIVSLTDGTTEAKLCNTFFNELAARCMVQGSWSTTITRAELAQTGNTPEYDFDYEYQLPVDPKCLKVLNIDEDGPGEIEYRIEGDKLLCDESPVRIRYIAELTDTSDYGPLLTECIELSLASYLAFPLTGDKVLAESLRKEYADVMMHNLALDGQQGSKDRIVSDTFIRDR